MTQTFGTNSRNDIDLGTNGNLSILTGQDAVVAACKSASLAQLGEMVLAVNAGLPNFQAIWVGVPNYAIWKQSLIQTLQNVPGVLQVANLKMFAQDNALTYTATISTQYGRSELQAALS